MKFCDIATILALVTMSSATCLNQYGENGDVSPADWGNERDEALRIGTGLCQGGYPSGGFVIGQEKARCNDIGGGKKLVTGIGWRNQGNGNLSPEQCVTYVCGEINDCTYGGRSEWPDGFTV